MPYLRITTSMPVDIQPRQALLKASSQAVALELGKPEMYVMVSMEISAGMLLGGTDEPCAFLELREIGLPASKTAQLSKLICRLVEDHVQLDNSLQ